VEVNSKIGLLLIDKHKIMRDGLKALFSNHPNIKIIGESDNPLIAGELVNNIEPQIVNLGINIDSTPVLESVKDLVRQFPKVKIIAHSVYLEREFICEMFKSGIFAYVHKEQNFSELLKAIDAVIHNEIYLCPGTSEVIMKNYFVGLSRFKSSLTTALTNRERRILKLLSEGCSSKQISHELHISSKTVDTHRRQIMNKLNMFSVPELTKYAIRCGLTSLN
jgi:DNA-binding NarL/FixJ family response regulator